MFRTKSDPDSAPGIRTFISAPTGAVRLAAATVRIGYAAICDPAPGAIEWLSRDERQRNFASERRRREFQSGRILLRLMLQQWTGRAPAQHEIRTSGGGKPVCMGGPAVSISHSGDTVAACVAATGEVGIDVESSNVLRAGPAIARRFFSRAEADWLDTQPADRFLMLWVLKEAHAKAIGQSVFRQLDKFTCTVTPPDIRPSGMHPSIRSLALFETSKVLIGLAATEESIRNVEFERWDLEKAGVEQDDPPGLLGHVVI